MSEGTIANWVKAEGDDISSGDVLCEIETDKATMEVEAIDDGVLGKILIAGGTEGVEVNTPIAIILEEGEDASVMGGIDTTAPAPAPADAPPKPAAVPVPAAPAPAAAPPPTATGKRFFASPLAKRLAEQNSLDVALIGGSGPHGRVIKRDTSGLPPATAGAPVVTAAIAPPHLHLPPTIRSWRAARIRSYAVSSMPRCRHTPD